MPCSLLCSLPCSLLLAGVLHGGMHACMHGRASLPPSLTYAYAHVPPPSFSPPAPTQPWHPSNFRNRVRVWETEQKSMADTKEKEKAKAEFDAEQEYLKTLSFLSEEQQQKYRDRQSISFM